MVVVIGESSSADHNVLYGCNGGWRSSLEGLDLVHLRAISPSNQTRYSVPIMLTGATAADFPRFFQAPSLVSDLKACGYKTYWLSNQPRVGRHEDNIASVSREADIALFLTEGGETKHYDGELVEKLRLIGNNGDAAVKRAFFIHLAGSHVDYRTRVPADFAPQAADRTQTYDATIRYTDTVLRDLFEVFPRQSLLFMYGSDHGEVLLESEMFGHGFVPSYQNEYRIPLLVWSSDGERLSRLTGYIGERTVNTESFDRIVRFLAGIEPDPSGVSFGRQVMDAAKQLVDYDKLANETVATPGALRVGTK